jgi:hypothetical protein
VIRFSDLRYALRLWRRHPAMIMVAGLSLGLGVGATTTMYSVVNRVAHYDLGFADEDRLVVLWRANPERGIRVVLGVAGGFGLSRALNSLFWNMTSADPVVLGGIAALMLAVALAAAGVPVHRVTRIDPQHALRQG